MRSAPDVVFSDTFGPNGPWRAELNAAGFAVEERGRDRIIIRSDWADFLRADLQNDFRDVPRQMRKVVGHGRVPHFSYHPRGAPGPVVVRALARGGLAGRLLGDLHGDSDRPLAELRAAIRASLFGVNTPRVLAAHSRKLGLFTWRHRIISQELPGAVNLRTLMTSLGMKGRKALLACAAREIDRLHATGVYPKDLTVGNLVASEGQVFIVDLDASRVLPSRDPDADALNIARLNRSAEKHVPGLTRTEKLRFLRHYLGGPWCLRDMAARGTKCLWRHRASWTLQRALAFFLKF